MYNFNTYYEIIVWVSFFLQFPLNFQLGTFPHSRLARLPLPYPPKPSPNIPRASRTPRPSPGDLKLFGRSLAGKLSRLGALGSRLVSLGSCLETSHRQKT
jgi:hypothetical protein